MPKIHSNRYNINTDSEINARMLRTIFEDTLGLRYDPERDSFVLLQYDHTGRLREEAWGILIEDCHDDKVFPHYVLEIGSGDYRNSKDCVHASGYARYRDYHSRLNNDTNRTEDIKIDAGRWTIQVWLPNSFDAEVIVWNLSDAYKKALDEVLLDHEILCSEALNGSEEKLEYIPLPEE